MNRSDFQRLANARLRDAQALLRLRRYGGAYYMAGYAAECALKACVAKLTRRYAFPERHNRENNPYTHDLKRLLKIAGLETALDADAKTRRQLGVNWAVIKDWTEESRYGQRTKAEAADLIAALVDPREGVMAWLSQRW